MQIIAIKLSAALHQTVEEMARTRSLNLECFLTQLLDAEAAAFRLEKYRTKPTPVIQPSNQAAADPDADLPTGHTQLTPEVIQKILESSKNLSIAELAKRFATSPTTIRRIVSAYQDRKHHPASTVIGRPAHSRPMRVSNSQRRAQRP